MVGDCMAGLCGGILLAPGDGVVKGEGVLGLTWGVTPLGNIILLGDIASFDHCPSGCGSLYTNKHRIKEHLIIFSKLHRTD